MTGPIDANMINPMYSGTDLADDLANKDVNLFGSGVDPTVPGTQLQPPALPNISRSMSTDLQGLSDAVTSAASQTAVTGSSPSDAANAAAIVSGNASNALSAANASNLIHAQQTMAKPLWACANDPSADFTFAPILLGSSANYPDVGATLAWLGFICAVDSVTKTTLIFGGSPSGTVTGMYLNIYLVNPATLTMTQVLATGNIFATIGSSSGLHYYTLPTPIAVTPGQIYAVEMVTTGSGTYILYGNAVLSAITNSAVFPTTLGASRNPATLGTSPTSLTSAQITPGGGANIAPLFGLGAAAAPTSYAPTYLNFTSPGSASVTAPAWAKYVDRIVLGAGGGGGGITSGFPGSAGGNSTVTVGGNTLTGAGGAGGIVGSATTAQSNGASPGPDAYGGVQRYGGTQVPYETHGNSPGGGGGGAKVGGTLGYGGAPGAWNADTQAITGGATVSFVVGAGGAAATNSAGAAAGAPGEVWLVFRQS